jgi:hypothetical protein
MALTQQVHTYTELRQQIHYDLRIQHPEWVQPNGESPMCDFYEARLMDLLDSLGRETDRTDLSRRRSALGLGNNRIPGNTRAEETLRMGERESRLNI